MTKELVMKLHDESVAGWNRHDAGALVDQLADQFEWRDTSLPGPLRTKEEVRQDLEDWFRAFPDIHVTITRQVVDDHAVAGEAEFSATHLGPLKAGDTEIPATGKRVAGAGAFYHRVEGDKFVEYSIHPDVAGLMAQLQSGSS